LILIFLILSPLYGFYLDERDFNAMIERGSVEIAVMARIEKQLLCVNERGVAETEVTFAAGSFYICVELDVESAPEARRSCSRPSVSWCS